MASRIPDSERECGFVADFDVPIDTSTSDGPLPGATAVRLRCTRDRHPDPFHVAELLLRVGDDDVRVLASWSHAGLAVQFSEAPA